MALSLSRAELVNDVDDDGIIDRFLLLPLIDRLARSQVSLSLQFRFQNFAYHRLPICPPIATATSNHHHRL
ncbi:hypothetical protein RHGRI_036954 [Rhododendron griersonianum]|uniref:Uncharacterized protein n=1 Tax=Rhododendron griersonianum TaxID=479676 RepID=A0AAV6HPW5_9ERIC|nr:hypothetical protein RHGRI_036954 [Rhododendron griersonianum]